MATIRFLADITLSLDRWAEDEHCVSWEWHFLAGELHEVGEVADLGDGTAVVEFVALGGFAEVPYSAWERTGRFFYFDPETYPLN